MAYVEPAPADLVARFPTFCDVNTDVVQFALDEAGSFVDDSWISEADFQLGKMLYAAHVLTCDGHGKGLEAKLASAGDFKTYKSGSLTLERASQAAPSGQSDGNAAWLAKTSYGQRFIALRRRSVPAVMVVC